jgi:hypothetical protein
VKSVADSGMVMAALAKRYAPPAWALLSQVGQGTGWARGRYADALALGLWPSRGLDLHGFEIKVYRGDWLRELKRPEKADAIAVYCDFWWLVAGPEVVDLDRDPIPTTWGVLTLNGRGLVKLREAERAPKPEPIDKNILAAIFRRASEDMTPRCSILDQINEAHEKGKAAGMAEQERTNGHAAVAERLESLERSVQRFEETSGVKVGPYTGSVTAVVFRAAERLDAARSAWQLKQAREALAASMERVKEAEAALAAITSPEGA